MLAVVGSLYAFAGKRKLVPGSFNPVRGIDKYPEKGRERFLSGQELARLGGAIREGETIGIPWQVDTVFSCGRAAAPGPRWLPFRPDECPVLGAQFVCRMSR
jgi:hypothetical protein